MNAIRSDGQRHIHAVIDHQEAAGRCRHDPDLFRQLQILAQRHLLFPELNQFHPAGQGRAHNLAGAPPRRQRLRGNQVKPRRPEPFHPLCMQSTHNFRVSIPE